MRLYTVEELGKEWVCLEVSEGRLVKLPYGDMNALLMDAPERRDQVLKAAAEKPGELALEAVRVLAPIPRPRQDVICLGMNYQAHKSEAEAFDPEAFTRQKGQAVYFSKRATYCPGPVGVIPGHFDLVDSLDYETELAVVLGRDANNVPLEGAFDYVFGYNRARYHRQRCVCPELADRAQAVVLWQGAGWVHPYGAVYRHQGRLCPAAGAAASYLGEWGIAAGGGDGPVDFLHPPHHP